MTELVKSCLGKAVFAKLSPGIELMEAIKETAEKADIDFGIFFVIGTLKQAAFGFYAPAMKPVTLQEPLEILSCTETSQSRKET